MKQTLQSSRNTTKHDLGHGTLTETGIKSEKNHCYMRDSICRWWYIVENVKIF